MRLSKNAGIAKEALSGSNMGVFVGAASSDYRMGTPQGSEPGAHVRCHGQPPVYSSRPYFLLL